MPSDLFQATTLVIVPDPAAVRDRLRGFHRDHDCDVQGEEEAA